MEHIEARDAYKEHATNCAAHQGAEEHCCTPGCRVHGLLQPWLLLLLHNSPSHGYHLLEKLGADELATSADPGLLYRTLRQLEQDGMVASTWDTEGSGPARRRYEITPEGVDFLHAWVDEVRRVQQRLDHFLDAHAAEFTNIQQTERR